MEEVSCALQEPKLEPSISTLTTTIHGVELENKEMEAMAFGPMLTMKLTIGGVPTKAMIDTSSLVAVVSLHFLLETLVRQCPTEQSLEPW